MDLYKIPDAPAEYEQALEEEFFKRLDNDAAVAHQKLIASPMVKLTGTELSAWSTFILSLLHRSPGHLSATKKAGVIFWKQALQEIRNDGRASPAVIDEYLRLSGPHEGEKAILRNLPALISNPKIGQFLNSCKWAVIEAPQGEIALLLSDDPLVRTNGLRTPEGHIAMPLSPRHLLIAAWKLETVQRIRALPIQQVIKMMNAWTVRSARHFVIAPDLRQQPFIEKHFGADPVPWLLSGVVEGVD